MKLLRIAPALLACVLAALLTACEDSPSSDPIAPDPLAMRAIAADAGGTAVLGAQAYTLGLLAEASRAAAGGRSLPPSLALGDTLLPGVLTCPVVTTQGGATSFLLRLEYGGGCASRLDGVTTSGRIEFSVAMPPPDGLDLTGDFAGFTRGGHSVDGILDLSGAGGVETVIATRALGVSGSGRTLILDMDLVLEKVEGGSPGDPLYCTAWRVPSGSANVEGFVGSEDISFLFSVADTLLLSTCCAYPTAGTLLITASGRIPALVDFGDGACDDQATLTLAGRSQEITLGD